MFNIKLTILIKVYEAKEQNLNRYDQEIENYNKKIERIDQIATMIIEANI